jgi:hypothetical protein
MTDRPCSLLYRVWGIYARRDTPRGQQTVCHCSTVIEQRVASSLSVLFLFGGRWLIQAGSDLARAFLGPRAVCGCRGSRAANGTSAGLSNLPRMLKLMYDPATNRNPY